MDMEKESRINDMGLFLYKFHKHCAHADYKICIKIFEFVRNAGFFR